ncbi:hypothetical protein BDZ97DRAFT_1826977 [Flammula alnicola]|nr:hypothetical protein BDZ97DRAFT_1826977 [Flammula alnicola]
MFVVGIAISPDVENQNKYSISVTLVSSADGSVIGTKSSSEASTTSTLAATLRFLLAEFRDPEPKYYLGSFSSALSPDRFHDVLEAFKGYMGFLPITYGQAFYSTLPEAENTSLIVFLYLSASHISCQYIRNIDVKKDGRLTPTIVYETNITLTGEGGLEDALKEVLSYGISQGPITRILLDYPPRLGSLTERAEMTISHLFPNAPMISSTLSIISHGAAIFKYIKWSHPAPRKLGQYAVFVPVSVTTSNGTAVVLVPNGYRIPMDQYITLTTSVKNQTSATDNLERGTVVLNGLKPLPKGAARIRIYIKIKAGTSWREAADITVEQEGGPSKGFMFPRFFSGLTEDEKAKYVPEIEEDDDDEGETMEERSEKISGELPE